MCYKNTLPKKNLLTIIHNPTRSMPTKKIPIWQQVLRKLEEQGKILAYHTQMLEEHTQTLEEHSLILQQHSEILAHHSNVLAYLTETLDEHTRILGEHTQALDDHSYQLEQLNINVTWLKAYPKVYTSDFDQLAKRVTKLETGSGSSA